MFLKYEGVTEAGERITGTFFGEKDDLIKNLKQNNIFILNIEEDKKRLKKGAYTLKQFTTDTEQLAYMISSGMKLDKAIKSLINNTSKQSSLEFWQDVLDNLRAGKQFSIALKESAKKHKIAISELYINIIGVGEEVGNLAQALAKVLNYLKFRNKLLEDVKSALAYPSFLIFVSIAAIFFIFYVILPKFASIFSPSDFERLPLISQIVIKIGVYVNQNPNVVLGVFFSAVFGIVALFYIIDPKKILVKILYQLPVLRDVYVSFELSNMFSSIGVMLEGGVDIAKAFRLSQDSVGLKSLKNLLKETQEELKKGTRISAVWSRYTIIPEDAKSLISVGENSAKLGEAFLSLADRYSDVFKNKTTRLMSLLEPTVIIFLGLFIGAIVVAIMLAVVSLNNVAV